MLKKIGLGLLGLIVVLAIVFAVGPRPQAEIVTAFDASTLGDDLDAYLADNEAAFDDLKDGQGKQIIWANGAKGEKTDLSVVYVHGFSASSGEIRPVPDRVAADLGANLFFTRLTGHGRSGDAMAEATAAAWMDDLAEAIAIGERLGEGVVLITTSTGGTLAKAGYSVDGLMDKVAGVVFVSPNFKIKNAMAPLLTAPWAASVLPALTGSERSFEPLNEAHATLWTTQYPTAALFPMAALVKETAKIDDATISVPALFVFDDGDMVVDAATTRQVAANWGGPSQIVTLENNDDPFKHVIAGDALSPSTNDEAVDAMVKWAREAH
ncbi:MAG: alpha/beta fold hydrolase [Pseudomonadota bacterium]